MKKCPNCGQTYPDHDMFCETCGSSLPEEPESQPKGKSPVPIIVGCVAAAAVLIAGTVFVCTTMLGGKKSEKTEQTVTQTADVNPGLEKPAETKPSGGLLKGKDEKETQRELPDNQELEKTERAPEEETEEMFEEPEAEETEEFQEDAESGEGEEGQTYYVVNCNEFVTLRKKPSTSAEEYCKIPLGTPVTFVESAGNGFCKVSYGGHTGYVLASYLGFESHEEPDAAVLMEVVNCKESITLRKIPSTKGEEFCQIPLGELVEYMGTAENGFYMVSYNGYTGYALASYLTEW